MTLLDQIIDEAEELARVGHLPDSADRKEIAQTLSENLHTRIDPESRAAKLGEAVFKRTTFLVHKVR